MKIPREAWWLAGLVILMLILAAALGGGREARHTGMTIDRTTYSSNPDGLRALYLTLGELGYDPRRMRTPLGDATLPSRGALVVVEPRLLTPIADREWAALQRWVSEGHSLILAGGELMVDAEEVFRPPADVFAEPPLTYARPLQPTFLARGAKRLAARAQERMRVPRIRAATHRAEDARLPPALRRYRSRPPEMAEALQTAVPLMADGKGTVAAYARVGHGRVIMLVSPWSLSNEGIGSADNLIFVLNALGSPQAGPVYFDEYHHGYGENLAWALLPLPAKIALGNLLLGVLVVLYARSRRLGAPVPAEPLTRQRSEFLGTMTALLRKGRATRLALRTAYEAAMQRLRLYLGVPADTTEAELARAAGRVNAGAGEKLGSALRRCRGALEGPETLSEARAMSLVRELDAAVESVRQV